MYATICTVISNQHNRHDYNIMQANEYAGGQVKEHVANGLTMPGGYCSVLLHICNNMYILCLLVNKEHALCVHVKCETEFCITRCGVGLHGGRVWNKKHYMQYMY